ncbi:hypothetical protein ACOSQ4_022862 [Xanthoceras sorbifolium]
MVGKFALQSVQVHCRSISLPARLHPNSLNNIEAELNKLIRTHEESLSLLLVELYNSIEDLIIGSPCTQQSLHNKKHVRLVEEALDRSVELLDACGNARELVSNMKDQVQELESALRRRVGGGDYSSMEIKIHAYMSFRKKSKKDIAKCLRELKRIDINIIETFSLIDSDYHQQLVLRESSALTVSIFRSILLFLSMPDMKPKGSGHGWSLIRKLMIPVASDHEIRSQQEINFNEVGSVDFALYRLHRQIRKDDAKIIIDMKLPLKRLGRLDVCIRDVESGLDNLFRRLIQNRVSLLNILTPA